MNPEAEQPDAGMQASEQETAVVPQAASSGRATVARPAAAVKAAPQRKAGVPVWRTGKPDAFLAAAVDVARTALEGITSAPDIGPHLAAKSEGDRLVTHLFESRLPGYSGWQWYAVLTRNSRSKVVTVNELGLLPSEDSILAPEWVPWAERVRPEDARDEEREQERTAPDTQTAEEPEAPVSEQEPEEAGPAQQGGSSDAGRADDGEGQPAPE
ncbi:conserved hypothetical protein [Pseudarthrobacter chlorophenolicus A6]|uniref:DUF3027 domain-containing protein n=1 Tax=Pseudarthrobacter chlorophenolicus (strain ATCC 700700 / DSM 12829 / CIP 107037 / JCM 12360 / KCTC 9906 / NCIMB 13794 / A6) TaxID=452863 RepID=B8HD99_PSECP|nr:DUF3027 domain-containing protein [Pseudarthrobacter chlorophenolicus]ACL38904.1 conserved hypothetical protein [Pseudarthrobacter chlorophenolicus A6]SDR07189.1 Protein of unknown function [Pseudarthrobacter chlorophenolicus]